jgi:hypothetical protein
MIINSSEVAQEALGMGVCVRVSVRVGSGVNVGDWVGFCSGELLHALINIIDAVKNKAHGL